MGDDQVGSRDVGEHPGGGVAEQGGEPPGGERLGVHRCSFPSSCVRPVVQGGQPQPAGQGGASASETSRR